jgi:transketolase
MSDQNAKLNVHQALEHRCINTIRFLAADAIEKAKSGHPGMPMGAAAVAYTLWTRHLKHNPADPHWPDRDRFILSSGHASMLLYALLYLTGYDLDLSDLQAFRQWGSKTPGHPEYRHTPGVEMTTGPLGQGISSAVGMAIAEAHLAARYNRRGGRIVSHYTYVLAGDGDLMEGVTAEACSLAGHLGLGKLIVLYDDNRVCLAGSTALSFTEDIQKRFGAIGWHVQTLEDGSDVDAIDGALKQAKAQRNRPSLICVRTTIGCGAPDKQNTCEAHGSPLGITELRGAKAALGWPLEPDFIVPGDVLDYFRKAISVGQRAQQAWKRGLEQYKQAHPDMAAQFLRIMAGDLPDGWESALPDYSYETKDMATRKASEGIMQRLAAVLPELMGGSADLNPSVLSWLKGFGDFQKPGPMPADIHGAVGGPWGREGQNIHFGVREHAMAAAAVGMVLHGGVIPFTGTFLTFCDYMRPSIRLAALMGLRVIYIFSHDSIGVGEDGPTHQPVEQLMSLRVIPNLTVIRPADACEAVEAWRAALLNRQGPTALIFTRQIVPALNRAELASAGNLKHGGYILWDSSKMIPQVILIGTGSEVAIALEAGIQLAKERIRVRVVSLPSWELFDRQPSDYRDRILPPDVRNRVVVEAGIGKGWERYIGLDGAVVGMDSFGASAPGNVLYQEFGITIEKVVEAAKTFVSRSRNV